VLYNGDYLIDGGAFDNYPVDIFTNNMTDDTLLGINLAAHCKNVDFDVDFFNYMTKLFTIIHHWTNINKIKKYKKYTIEIKTYDNTEIMNSDISLEEKNRRINHGYDAAVNHFELYEIVETESSEDLIEKSEDNEEDEDEDENKEQNINS
jgi:predicted acylesterase/phospholipase RssA